MKDLIQTSRAVEARLRELEYEMQEEAANTISELCTALEAAQRLSVTNIMLYVSPGWDGMGHEVYAKSVDEVVEVLSKLGCQAEDAEGNLYTARVKLEAAQKDAERYRWLRDYSARMKFGLTSTVTIAVPNAWMPQDSTESDDDVDCVEETRMKLPDPAIRQEQWNRNSDGEITSKAPDFTAYTAAQMRQYRIDTLEEAALLCEAHAVSCMLLSEIDQNFPLHQHHLGGEQAAQHLMRIVRKLKEKKHE